ncbi:hypothetical protein [Nonlabens sp.]|uniref:hypothetical protein n=1 Tax=Nonlabens sp. TaxID=1888209 RepID=UPI003265CEF0
MKKHHALLVLLLFMISCTQSDKKTDEDIYEFMSIMVIDQKLNLNYGLSIEPDLSYEIIKKSKNNSVISNTDSSYNINDFSFKPGSFNLTDQEIGEMTKQKEKHTSFSWDNDRLGFNVSNKNYWYKISVPVFSKDKSKVFIKISELCPGLCGSGKTILFIKENNQWRSATGLNWLH